MAETYKVELFATGPYVGSSSTELVDLSDYDYTDEEWDGLSDQEKGDLLDEWGEQYFWNEGYEYNAEVQRG